MLAADAAEKAAAAAAEVWERAAASLSRGEADLSEAVCARAAAAKQTAAAQRAAAARALSQQVACAEWWRAEAGVSATEDEQAWERYRHACKGSASKTPFPWLRALTPPPQNKNKEAPSLLERESIVGSCSRALGACLRGCWPSFGKRYANARSDLESGAIGSLVATAAASAAAAGGGPPVSVTDRGMKNNTPRSKPRYTQDMRNKSAKGLLELSRLLPSAQPSLRRLASCPCLCVCVLVLAGASEESFAERHAPTAVAVASFGVGALLYSWVAK